MSSSTPGQTSIPSSSFKSILDAALSEYKKSTGKELLDHPFATEVQGCDSVDAIKATFQGQAEAFQRFRDSDRGLMRWINPVVDVLYTFSETLGGSVAVVRFRDRLYDDKKRHILTFLYRHSPLPKQYLSELEFSLLSASSPPLVADPSNTNFD